MLRRSCLAAVAVVLVTTAAGCGRPVAASDDTAGPPSPVTTPAAFRPDLARWTLPLDRYRESSDRLDHTESALVSACLRPFGVSMPVIDPADYTGATFNDHQRRLFTTAIAARWGYHNAPGRQDPDTIPRVRLSATDDARAATCQQDAEARLHRDSPAQQQLQSIAIRAYTAAKQDPGVTAAAGRWRTCMSAGLDLSDQPASPVDMPTASQHRRWGWSEQADAEPPPISSDEIREATVDARCRAGSGFSAQLYTSETDQQLALMRTAPATLTAALADLAAERAVEARVLPGG